MEWIFLLVAAFLLGSVPFGHLVAKSRGVDIRAVGSGNIGATNVVRAIGKKAGLLVLGLDVLKGLAPSLLGYTIVRPEFMQSQQELALLAGLTAVAGHCFSPFIGFRGGKGVATGLGAMLGGSPVVAGISLGVFLAFLAITRYVSLSSMIAVALMPLSGWLLGHSWIMIAAYGLLGGFIILRHTGNIRKLLEGTERSFSLGGGSQGPSNDPDSHCNDPDCHCSDPDSHCNDPDSHCSDPDCHCNDPDCHCNDRDCHCSDPDSHCSDPDCHCSDPDSHCSDPDSHCNDPDCHCNDPDCHCNDPESDFTGRNGADGECIRSLAGDRTKESR